MKPYVCEKCKKPKGMSPFELAKKGAVQKALSDNDGNLTRAASYLGLTLPTVRRYAKMYGLR